MSTEPLQDADFPSVPLSSPWLLVEESAYGLRTGHLGEGGMGPDRGSR